ncbi:putative leader peptide [Pseudonocardia thermophila]
MIPEGRVCVVPQHGHSYVPLVLRLVARRHVDLMRVASAACRLPR